MRHLFPEHDDTFHVFTAGGILGFYTIQCNLFALIFLGSVLPPSAVILGYHDMLPKKLLRSLKRNTFLPILTKFRTPMHNLNMETGMRYTHCRIVLISQSDQLTKAMLW